MFNCNSCTASVMLGRDIKTTAEGTLHIAMCEKSFRSPVGVALETGNGKLCNCEGNIVL
jgi:hypothetical protein